jgi:hypothetical protein
MVNWTHGKANVTTKDQVKCWHGGIKSVLYILSVVVVVVVVVSMGVRGKPRMYYSLLAYCTARFGRSNFGLQMPPRLPTRFAL